MEPQEKILKTALELFYKNGIKRITMDDIAKELGMSKKTIYQFYKEKDEIIYQLFLIEMTRHEQLFKDIENQAKDPVHELILISNTLTEMMQKINPIFFYDLKKYYPKAFEMFKQFKEQCACKDVMRNIKQGKLMGIYREDVDDEITAKYRIAQMDMIMFGDYFSFEKTSFTKTHELLLDIYMYGICTVKGHRLINNYKKIKVEE